MNEIAMKQDSIMKKILKVLVAAVIYLVLFVLGATSGLIHPAVYAYIGTFLPLLFAFIFFYTSANMQCFGAALALNGFVLVIGLIVGEGNLPLVIGLVVLTLIAESVRKLSGYDTIKGVRYSFIPFAFSFYAYSAHWWTDTQASLAEAMEEMPAGYADKMAAVIGNIPILIIALVLTIPIAIVGIRIAEKALKKQAAKLQ